MWTLELIIPNDKALHQELLKEAEFYCLDNLKQEIQRISIPKKLFIGATLLTVDHQKKINEWCGTPNQQWTLLYKATRDGFDTDHFHNACNNKGPTCTVIKFTGRYWWICCSCLDKLKCLDQWRTLYLINNNNVTNAMYDVPGYESWFGGHDLVIYLC